jgi:hypothetical protein
MNPGGAAAAPAVAVGASGEGIAAYDGTAFSVGVDSAVGDPATVAVGCAEAAGPHPEVEIIQRQKGAKRSLNGWSMDRIIDLEHLKNFFASIKSPWN